MILNLIKCAGIILILVIIGHVIWAITEWDGVIPDDFWDEE